jgi:hypothetical protein
MYNVISKQNEIKNFWKSADDVRRTKDDVNGHKDKTKSRRKTKSAAHHPTLCRDCAQSNKCNIQKVSFTIINPLTAIDLYIRQKIIVIYYHLGRPTA